MHVEFLNLDNEKMSKSLGNVFTVRDILDKGHRASALRYLLLSVHYRKQLTFNWDVLEQAEAALTRLADFLARLGTVTGGAAHPALEARVVQAQEDFREMIASDLNIPGALGVMFDLVRDMNAAMDRREAGAPDAALVREAFAGFDRVLGVHGAPPGRGRARRRCRSTRSSALIAERRARAPCPQLRPRRRDPAASSTPAASCSKITPRARAGSGNEAMGQ